MNRSTRVFSPHRLAETAFRLRELGVFTALVLTVVFFSIRTANFATAGNWRDIATDVSMVIVVAVGETMVILTRNIDLSVGSIVGLTAYVSSNTLADHHGMPLVATAALAMAVGLACGIGNGLLVAIGRIPAIIATLATLAIYRGVLFQVTHGQNVFAAQLPQNFLDFASKAPAGVPTLAWIAIGVALVGGAVLRWAPWARDFYAIGSNPDAARLAGIPTARRIMAAFAISGALAGLGGFMFAARFATVDAIAGRGFELDVVTAVVIGGVNVFGGSGTILGAVLGALLVATIQNGFTLLHISEFWKIFFNGVAIVVVVTIDALITHRLQETLRRRRRAEIMASRKQVAET
jgi:rhamnose transport system permease protein